MSPAEAHQEALRRIEQARAESAWLLDLGALPLAELPEELGSLTGLRVLALGKMTALPGKDDVEWGYDYSRPSHQFPSLHVLKRLTGLEQVSIEECGVSDLGPLSGLTNLQSLDLSYTGVSDLEPLAGLTNLQRLNLNNTGVSDLGLLAGLTGLRELNLWSTGASDLGPLAGLTSLQSLSLGYCNNLSDLGPLAGLTSLQSLNLNSTCVSDLAPLSGLTSLQSLDLGYCKKLSDLRPLSGLTSLQSLDLSDTGVSDLAPLSGLTSLESLYLSGSGVLDLAPLSRLTTLQDLFLNHTGVSDLSPLSGLTSLLILGLIGTAVSQVDPVSKLTSLRQLWIQSCERLHSFGRLRDLLPTLENLYLQGNEFDDLPDEVCGEGLFENVLDAVRAHFADLEIDAVEDAELKLFVLGNGSVGKTQMCRRLCGLPFDPSIPTTHGVQLGHFSLPLEGRAAPVQVRLWDFGGQDVYHGTHALFLQKHAIFVVLWTPHHELGETEENGVLMRHRPLTYWLDYIRSLAGTKAPVLVVQSQCDDERDCRKPPTGPTEDFAFLETLEFSARTDAGLDLLSAMVKRSVRKLLAKRPLQKVGAGRIAVRDRLRATLEEDQARPPAKRRHRTLTQEKFRGLCEKTKKVSDPRALLDYLHRGGVVFYRPNLFEDRIILDQAWACEAIYTVFHRQRTLPYLRQHGGRFTRDDLALLAWQEHSEEEQEIFLGMMQSCGICFRVRNLSGDAQHPRWQYAAPDLLPEWAGVQHELRGRIPNEPPAASAVVRYSFLHEGILRAFLSRIGDQARDSAVYWKYGCWVWEEKTQSSMVIRGGFASENGHGGAGQIEMSAWGAGSEKLLDHVLQTLLSIPLGQPPVVTRTPARPERPMPEGEKPGGGVEQLAFKREPPPRDRTAKEVFLSYAWGEDVTPQGREREQMADALYARLKQWGYQPIRDRKQMKRGDLISEFMARIGRGDRVVVVLSKKYLESVFCMTELHEIYRTSGHQKAAFLGRIIPLPLADARISSIGDRVALTRYWKQEKDALQQAIAEGLLATADYDRWRKMNLWMIEVPEMLEHIADMLVPIGFEEIARDDFAAVKELLERDD